jgi:hypothetical protein
MVDDRIDTTKLITDANAGQGCTILDAFDGKSLQSQIVAIAEMNERFHKMGSNLFGLQEDTNPVHLKIRETGLSGNILFEEYFNPSTRKIDFSCTNKTATGEVSKTVHRSF